MTVRVERGMRQGADAPFEQLGQNRLAQPPQRQARDRDSQLHAIDDAAELLMQLEDDFGAGTVRFDQLLDAGFAHTDQREFGGRKKRVHRHQQQYNEHPQQHGCNHGTLILTFHRGNARFVGGSEIASEARRFARNKPRAPRCA